MKNVMNSIWNLMKLSAFIFPLSVFVSCSQEEFLPQETTTLQFVVSDFPMFGEGIQTRVIGTQDEGKTAWENGDQIIVTLISKKYGEQAVALTYDGSSWSTEASLSYLENETPTITAVYAPDCEIKEGQIALQDGKQYGEAEYILARTTISGNTLDIRFESGRTYSRLRIVGLPNQTLTVTTTDFTPAGANNSFPESGATRAAEEALNVLPCPKEGSTVPCATGARSVPQAEGSVTYTLTTDNNGNAFLYGVFAEDATVSVKQGDITLKDYTFTAEKNPNGTAHNKSYALDATPVIDGTLGGKAEATAAEVETLVQQLKDYVDNGITTIIVPGTEYAMYKSNLGMIPAFAEALYLLTDNSQEESQYRGTIDLILPDATEIIDFSFDSANALKSITLPKVTTVGDGAFYGCQYLGKMTFGSVITEVVEIKSGVFASLGIKSDNEACDLVLNCGQLNAEDKYKPNLESNVWYIGEWSGETEWKSITLTHTGECDECKANQ